MVFLALKVRRKVKTTGATGRARTYLAKLFDTMMSRIKAPNTGNVASRSNTCAGSSTRYECEIRVTCHRSVVALLLTVAEKPRNARVDSSTSCASWVLTRRASASETPSCRRPSLRTKRRTVKFAFSLLLEDSKRCCKTQNALVLYVDAIVVLTETLTS